MQVSRLIQMIHPDTMMFYTEWTEGIIGANLKFTDHTLVNHDDPLNSDFLCNVWYKDLFIGLFSYEKGVKQSTAHYGNAEEFLLDIIHLYFTGQERHGQDTVTSFPHNPLG